MKNKFIIYGFLIIGMAFSCSPDRLNKTNPNQLTPDNYFKNSAELRTGVNSIYATVQGNGLVAREYFFLHDLRSDEVSSGGGQLETPRNQILIGAQISNNAVLNEVWNALYITIHRANTVIEKSVDVTDDPTVAASLLGEAKFLRAWSYFQLVSLWGGVPIQTQVATSSTNTNPRSTEAEVYTLIGSDLTEAIAVLPENASGVEPGRATKGAARMLLAKAAMNQGDYATAKTILAAIKTSGIYQLTDNYYDNFSEETEWNRESIFEVGYSSIGDVNWVNDGNDPSWGNQEKSTRSQEYSATGWRNLIPSQKLIDEFESTYAGDPKTDPRRALSIIKIGDKYANNTLTLTDGQVQGNTASFEGVTTKVSWYKYGYLYKQDPGGYLTSGINHRIMRYADAILLLAECENETGNSAGAITLLNEIRSRPSVAMPNYPTAKYPCTNKEEVFAAIQHERLVELSGEQVRNLDIMRWRKNGKLSSEPISYFVGNKQELLPIPQTEIDLNDKIEGSNQNTGY